MYHDNPQKVVIKGSCVRSDWNYALNIVLEEPKITIMRGTVYDANGEPSVGAALEVREINICNTHTEIVGYTYTDCEGQYVFPMIVDTRCCYEIAVYSPLADPKSEVD